MLDAVKVEQFCRRGIKVDEIISNMVAESVFEIIAGSTCCAEGLFERDLEECFHSQSIGQFIDA